MKFRAQSTATDELGLRATRLLGSVPQSLRQSTPSLSSPPPHAPSQHDDMLIVTSPQSQMTEYLNSPKTTMQPLREAQRRVNDAGGSVNLGPGVWGLGRRTSSVLHVGSSSS